MHRAAAPCLSQQSPTSCFCHCRAYFLLSASQGLWLSSNGQVPNVATAQCTLFGLPLPGAPGSSTCYSSGSDTCGDLKITGSQRTVSCLPPLGASVPCLANGNGKLMVRWCVTYFSSQTGCTTSWPGPLATNAAAFCYCGQSKFFGAHSGAAVCLHGMIAPAQLDCWSMHIWARHGITHLCARAHVETVLHK